MRQYRHKQSKGKGKERKHEWQRGDNETSVGDEKQMHHFGLSFLFSHAEGRREDLLHWEHFRDAGAGV